MRFSLPAARALVLAVQGLSSPPEHPATKSEVLECVQKMGVLQIDSIAVVARSPYFVLWSRLGSYEPRWLDELLAEGALFEYWSHAASLIPIKDYGLYRRLMLDGSDKKTRAWFSAHPKEVGRVLSRIREGGEVRSADFERTDGRAGGWWEWKAEKRALEHLFAAGELMISRRDPNFHRVYDLRERVLRRALPEWDDTLAPSHEEVRRALALRAVRALGVSVARWVPDYFRTPKKGITDLLEELASEGSLLHANLKAEPAYVHPDNAELAEAAVSGELRPSLTTLLSPFDPVVWDRTRALELFGFEYKIEVYTPAARRRYGYYSLPILHRGELVGRLDGKAHRKEELFEVRALHLDPGVPVAGDLVSGLAGTVHRCAQWHGTPEIVVRRSDPPELAEPLAAAIEASGPGKPRGRSENTT